jgi:diacylglycerol kinase (ATP)
MKSHTKPNGAGLTRLLNAVVCSRKGFSYVWKNEAAFRQEALLCALCVPLALFLGDGGLERALLTGSVLSILLVELINSSIECIIDRIGSEYHELSGSAKDLGSAAVSMSIILTAVIWVLILWR